MDQLISIILSGKTHGVTNYSGNELGPTRSQISHLSIADQLGTFATSYSKITSEGSVFFGTGTTPPTYDDYSLSGEIISGLTITTSVTNENNGTEITALYTITNTSGADVTIGEIGLFFMKYMIDRTVLETPLTITNGSIGQLTYTIQLNYPVS
jgi:hypothetical protein